MKYTFLRPSLFPIRCKIQSFRFFSNVSKGVAFELHTVEYLPRICPFFSISRVGRRGDGGIDFRGHLQYSEHRIPVIGQCKIYSKMLSPDPLRAFFGVLNEWNYALSVNEKALGVFVVANGFTETSKTFTMNYPSPIILLSLTTETSNPRFTLCIINRMAQKLWPNLKAYELYRNNQRHIKLKLI
ncbi:hypothetical protein HMI56_003510 [Coelomomyces lativittatus]|nr:hypothetical protein HMI56_003510 [Coelomomyces lativittatus]